MSYLEIINLIFVAILVLWAFLPNVTMREYVWPIRGEEWYKFLPMGAMMLCILFNYSTFRAIKDALVVSAIGAEAIPFVKLGCVLPGSVLMVMLYIYLLNLFGNLSAFYIISFIFIAYLLFFVFSVVPNPELFDISLESFDTFFRLCEVIMQKIFFYFDFSSIVYLDCILNIGLNLGLFLLLKMMIVEYVLVKEYENLFYKSIYLLLLVCVLYIYFFVDYNVSSKGFEAVAVNIPVLKLIQKIVAKWTYIVFYVLAELFGVLYIGFFFWAKANQDTLKNETKRFYPAFGIIGNIGPILTGQVATFTLYNKIIATLVSFAALIFLYTYISSKSHLYEKQNEMSNVKEGGKSPVKKKPKLSIGESIVMVFNSRQLLLIATLIVSYGTTMILLESVWKYNIKLYTASNINAYSGFMSYVLGLQGIAAAILLIIGANILKCVSWTVAALITPIIMIGTGFVLLVLAYICDMPMIAAGIIELFSVNSVLLIVLIGAIQNVSSKGTKYALFDTTKEMAYRFIANPEEKVKGKAAADIVGGRLGKSLGSFILIIFISAGFQYSDPNMKLLILGSFSMFMVLWIWAIYGLSANIEKLKLENSK